MCVLVPVGGLRLTVNTRCCSDDGGATEGRQRGASVLPSPGVIDGVIPESNTRSVRILSPVFASTVQEIYIEYFPVIGGVAHCKAVPHDSL